MNRILYVVLLHSFFMTAQFVEFDDTSQNNSFLGSPRVMCSIVDTNRSKKNYQQAYDCDNKFVSELLNVNFVQPGIADVSHYIFNNFINNIKRDVHSHSTDNTAPDTQFSGGGIFMIELGATAHLQKLVAPTKTCPQGQRMLCAQLKYNNGSTLTTWSQDAICLAPNDTFIIQISSDKDTTAPVYQAQNIADDTKTNIATMWGVESGPSSTVYDQAGSSPRKIRLIKKGA
jgi:hypothetical protein